ncbi:hypothetical protein SARC_02113 [Sphaeroforma arctica JP610]|uniref:Uncharacterized protein n=1 Tax=Sphaeroforma arctica JP610 TaxID=667725 RepID=A0A0L0G9K0_9EUKA|nr:hypothetical protein SARC_02113 [Sphaeroforma arctica JP610]KNC85702.1 hypothetical protein SARC_02113 [Sphaeroforma arctica JP610]|eukprot:XP_014159604.1 hypothetical protein SARC_02113 [Sphaeroforma arctica JP610]
MSACEVFELVAKEMDFGDAVIQGGLLGEGNELNEEFIYAADGDEVEVVTEAAIERERSLVEISVVLFWEAVAE